MRELVEFLARELVDDPDAVRVTETSDDRGTADHAERGPRRHGQGDRAWRPYRERHPRGRASRRDPAGRLGARRHRRLTVDEPTVVVGKVTKAHGLTARSPSRCCPTTPTASPTARRSSSRTAASSRRDTRWTGSGLLVAFAAIGDRTPRRCSGSRSSSFRGRVTRAAPGRVLAASAEGCVVVTETGRLARARSRDVVENPANDLWVAVDDAGVETLVPAIREVVVDVDVGSQRIVVLDLRRTLPASSRRWPLATPDRLLQRLDPRAACDARHAMSRRRSHRIGTADIGGDRIAAYAAFIGSSGGDGDVAHAHGRGREVPDRGSGSTQRRRIASPGRRASSGVGSARRSSAGSGAGSWQVSRASRHRRTRSPLGTRSRPDDTWLPRGGTVRGSLLPSRGDGHALASGNADRRLHDLPGHLREPAPRELDAAERSPPAFSISAMHDIRDQTNDPTPPGGRRAVRRWSGHGDEGRAASSRRSSRWGERGRTLAALTRRAPPGPGARRASSRRNRGWCLICGRYEGVDERVVEGLPAEEISIGDYVLSGGELPALVVLEAVTRLVPGVIGKEESHEQDSFGEAGLLDHPHFTRPREFRGMSRARRAASQETTPEIERWRREAAREKTRRNRPDLMAGSRTQ